jgi:hypothetical protein
MVHELAGQSGKPGYAKEFTAALEVLSAGGSRGLN